MTATVIETLKTDAAERYRQLVLACQDETQAIDGTDTAHTLAVSGKSLVDLERDIAALRQARALEARTAEAQSEFDGLREQLDQQAAEVTRLRVLAQQSAADHEHARQKYIGVSAARYSSSQRLNDLQAQLRQIKQSHTELFPN